MTTPPNAISRLQSGAAATRNAAFRRSARLGRTPAQGRRKHSERKGGSTETHPKEEMRDSPQMRPLKRSHASYEDRTWQYEEKTQHNHWMQEMMLDKYLWNDSLTDFEPAWKKFFAKPSEFLSTLTARSKQGDSWSYVEVDTLSEDSHKRGYYNHVDSYGFDFVLMKSWRHSTLRLYLEGHLPLHIRRL